MFPNNTVESNFVEDKIIQLVELLPDGKLFIVPFEEIQKHIIMSVRSDYRMLLYKRFMLRIAEKVAEKEKITALATGDSLAQVASQTVENIEAIYSCVNLPILTPLLGMDKQEIVDVAREIKTYEVSILPYNDCCSLFISKSPQTKAKETDLMNFEKNLEVNKLINNAIKNVILK